MLFPVAGASFLIQDDSGWLTVAEVESLGTVGGLWDMVDLRDKDDDGESRFMKVGRTPGQIQVIFGLDTADAGQLALWSAYNSYDNALFRIEFPAGLGWRQFSCLVIGLTEVFDAANEVARMEATLQINSTIERG